MAKEGGEVQSGVHYSIVSIFSFIFAAIGFLIVESTLSGLHWILGLMFEGLALISGFLGVSQIDKNKEMRGSIFAWFGILLAVYGIFYILIKHFFVNFGRLLGF